MTNEKHIHSLNTDGLAELLYEYRYDNANPKERLWLEENKKFCKHTIVDWLKRERGEVAE